MSWPSYISDGTCLNLPVLQRRTFLGESIDCVLTCCSVNHSVFSSEEPSRAKALTVCPYMLPCLRQPSQSSKLWSTMALRVLKRRTFLGEKLTVSLRAALSKTTLPVVQALVNHDTASVFSSEEPS
ncbi:hypothetical protein BaRGS_00028743 [Batillaria attramentaria]|uniref:Uncharacterized protein n=1 Tax=Batillaria attramentaria TaxID=370345 RepID=A0ABD0JZK2_9CAEN